ncbi:MAG TPA: hydrogenase maturation protease [Terriglobales bacterium]|nr:hydrogenase maturation protease [Terriglobales bacterium]
MSRKVLIAGVGNIFLGDDAFGVEVAQRLMRLSLPEGVSVREFGIRGFDLAYAMMEVWDLVILADATQRGGRPGTIYVIDAGDDSLRSSGELQPHGMTPMQAIDLVKVLGGTPPPMLVIGCEPADLGGEDGFMGLSPAVERAVTEAVAIIEEKAEKFVAAAAA